MITSLATVAVGTCPACGQRIPIVNYTVERGHELGYLGRHSRPCVTATSKCRGSFGYWAERAH